MVNRSVILSGNTKERVRDLLPPIEWLETTLMHYALPPTLSGEHPLTRTTISIYKPEGNTSGDPSEDRPLTLCSLIPILVRDFLVLHSDTKIYKFNRMKWNTFHLN